MRTIPLSVLLSWPTPNYTNPVTRGPAAVVIIIVLSCFVVVAVSLRVYTRVCVQRWSGLDDLFMILAVLSTIGLNASVVLAIDQYGWSRHIYDIPPSLLAASGLVVFVAKLHFFVATSFLRLSLLSFYYRLVHDAGKYRFRCALHASVAFVITLFLCSFFLSVFVCVPISDYWHYPPRANRKCYTEGPVGFVVAIINCFADLLITCLPIPLVLQLNMPLRNRLGVLALFCLGFVILIASALRTYYYYQSNIVSYDMTWAAYPLWIASTVEVNLALICACAPALRVLIKRRCIPAITDLTRSMASRAETTRTVYSNPPNSPMPLSFQKVDEEQGSKRCSTPMTPTSPASLYYTNKAEERDSSVIHLDVYDVMARKQVHVRDPARKSLNLKSSLSEITGSESGSECSLLVPGQAIYAWNDGASR